MLIQIVIMIRTQVSLERDMYEEAKREAGRQGISFAELVRRALARVLPVSETLAPWMCHAGTVAEGDREASTSVDRVVYGRDRP